MSSTRYESSISRMTRPVPSACYCEDNRSKSTRIDEGRNCRTRIKIKIQGAYRGGGGRRVYYVTLDQVYDCEREEGRKATIITGDRKSKKYN